MIILNNWLFLFYILDSPYIKTKSRAYRVPLRTPEVKLHCVITANPRAAISWMFLPRNFSEFSLRNKKNIPSTTASYNYNWIMLNSFATYSFKAYPNHKETKHDETTTNNNNNSQSHLQMLPISKYQIYEKVYNDNQIDSVLIIKVGIIFIFKVLAIMIYLFYFFRTCFKMKKKDIWWEWLWQL